MTSKDLRLEYLALNTSHTEIMDREAIDSAITEYVISMKNVEDAQSAMNVAKGRLESAQETLGQLVGWPTIHSKEGREGFIKAWLIRSSRIEE